MLRCEANGLRMAWDTFGNGVTTLTVGMTDVGVLNFYRFDDITPHFRHRSGWERTRVPTTGRWRPLPWFSSAQSTNDFGTYWRWQVPLWFVVVPTGIPPWWWFRQRAPKPQDTLSKASKEANETSQSPTTS